MNTAYPLFIPPKELGTRTPAEWTSSEADAYLRWLTANLNARVSGLLTFFDDNLDGRSEDVLNRLGRSVGARLKDETFSKVRSDGPELTSAGFALAADMGLLVAMLLLRDCGPTIHWKVLRFPKSDVSFNCPVLSGFGRIALDPINGSIGEAFGVLREVRFADAWTCVYTYWKKKVNLKTTDGAP